MNKINSQHLFQKAIDQHLKGNLDQAISLYDKIIQENPEHSEALHNIGVIYLAKEENRSAVEVFRRVLHLNPNYVDALVNLGTALKRERDSDGALDTFRQALSIKPDSELALFNLANLYRDMGKYELAVDTFKKVIALNPSDYESYNSLGSTLSRFGRYSEAKQVLKKTLSIKPDHASALYNLGTVLLREGSLDEAKEAFASVLRMDSNLSDAYLNLGYIEKKQEAFTKAAAYFQKAVETDSHSADAYYNLGLLYEAVHDLDHEIAIQKDALMNCPDAVQTWIGSVRAFSKIADWRRVDPLIKKISEYRFGEADNSLLSTALFILHSYPVTDDVLFEKHCQWGDRTAHETNLRYSNVHFDFSDLKQNDGKLRIGYVSPDFCRHSVGWFFKQIASWHDPESFQIHCYASDTREDDVTHDIKKMVSSFCEVHDWNTDNFARKIHKDNIQILVDLAGHTKGNRMDVFALRPAPIQVTMMGYPNGSGLSTMDYRISDHLSETPSRHNHYREKLVLLSKSFLPFGRLDYSKITLTRKALGLPDHFPLLVSFNRAGKLRPEVLKLWDRILTRCPQAILALGCGHTYRKDLTGNLLSHFSQTNHNRVFFLDRAKSEESHRSRYILADLALDSFPYAGTTTSYEALFMNVPVVTLVGDRHVQRTTYSVLKHLGIEETIAGSEEDYLNVTASLLEDPNLLHHVKAKLADAIARLVPSQSEEYTRELEHGYRIMWHRYQVGESPREISF